jgi:hypothetical protein
MRGAALTTPVYTGPTSSFSGAPVPHALVMGLPVPLSAFRGVNLGRVRKVSVVALGRSGDITIADVSFQR